MKKHVALLIAVPALLLPVLAAQGPVSAQGRNQSDRAQTDDLNIHAAPERVRPEMGLDAVATPPFRMLQSAPQGEILNQVRIRQRVIIRISPSTPDTRERMMASLPRSPSRSNFEEVAHDDCVEVEDIVGVQPTQDNRLLFFMSNHHVLAASLERSCTARAFYSGFYVERSDDGRLCIGRDRLQSRAGASCAVAGLTRIVAASS